MLPPVLLPAGEDPRAASETAQILGGILHLAVGETRAPDEENSDITAQLVLQTAIRFTQETLRAIAHSGTAEFFPGGKANFPRDARIAQDIENHMPSRGRMPLLVDALEVTAPLDHLAARQCIFFLFHIR